MYRDEEKLSDQSRSASPDSGRSSPTSRTPQMLESYSRYARRRFVRPLIIGLCVLGVWLQWTWFGSSVEHMRMGSVTEQPEANATLSVVGMEEEFNATGLHFLIHANDVDVDLCRTLLTAGILTFPSPTILSGDEVSGQREVSRFPKISRVLNYVDSLDAAQDDEFIFIVDGDDVQFQLPVDVLLSRYHRITRAATAEIRASVGTGDVRQSVLMGADKRCASPATKDALCYPAPPSPAPEDLYGNNTDVAGGYNKWFHYRPKYVNPGYILGPVGDVRRLFERAEQKAKNSRKGSELASTSEQGVFAKIFSEQERWRERVSNFRWSDETQDELNPLASDVNYEFGILVDYFSELGHTTMNSDFGRDSQFIVWNDEDSTTFYEQANDKHQRDGHLDCAVSVPDTLPSDLIAMGPPFYLLHFRDNHQGSTYDYAGKTDEETYRGPGWMDVPLYTHLCMGTVPVLIHQSGDPGGRNSTWEKLWLRQRSNALLQMTRDLMEQEGSGAVDVDDWTEFKKMPGVKAPGGAWGDDGQWRDWFDICPYDVYGQTLFYRGPKDHR